ncbi:40S ribosomal protein S7 [Ceratobasidium sp. AG-Ba]|nr:40S ribosomal protein S7 [Ceratobasidium sp. AG-Ba]QRW13898.1 40S ribosomal protein S7 [Ceratobasidium sp. AG-Ba]
MRNAAATNPELLVPPTEMPPGVPQEMVDTLAKQSKEEGDKLYREKKYQAAHDAYKYGCVLPTSDPNIRKSIMLNMAAVNLLLKDWFTVLRNTAWVLQTDPDSVKGLYRAARALLQLARFDEALDCCDRALKLEPHNKPLRKERQTALSGAILLSQRALSTAYRHNHLLIVPSAEDLVGTEPATKPSMLPYLDPPIPANPRDAVLSCCISISYPERSAADMLADFPFDQPILPLFDVLLPGSAPSDAISPLREKLVVMPHPSSSISSEQGILHPTLWDPKHEFLPSTLAVYTLTRHRTIIPITGQMTLADVCAEAKSLTGDLYGDTSEYDSEKEYIEVMQGIILLEAFRAGSEAEERFEEADFESLSDLAEPGYEASKTVTINTRYRNFNYGPPNRPVNDENSVSFAARHGMIRILCGI